LEAVAVARSRNKERAAQGCRNKWKQRVAGQGSRYRKAGGAFVPSVLVYLMIRIGINSRAENWHHRLCPLIAATSLLQHGRFVRDQNGFRVLVVVLFCMKLGVG